MALVSLQTRLRQTLQAAQQLRNVATVTLSQVTAGPLPLLRVQQVRNRMVMWLAGVVAEYEHDAALATYADFQFPEAPFNLAARIAGVKALLTAAKAECDTLIGLGVGPFTTQQTADLKSVLEQVVAGIEE